MTKNLPQKDLDILTSVALSCARVRKNMIEIAEGLYYIKTHESWKFCGDSFEEYLEDKCQIDPGFASKLIKVWQYYVIDGKVEPLNLVDVGTEKLYMAMRLPGPAGAQLVKAGLLTRTEIRNELLDPEDECAHPDTITICAHCHKRI